MLREVIPYDATHKSLAFIKQKFVGGQLSPSEAAEMFLMSLQIVKTDERTMNIAKASLP